MHLIIAEKPAVAAAISEAFGGPSRPSGGAYLLPNGDAVTWLYGHIVSLSDPEEHDARFKRWSMGDLPMVWPISHRVDPKHQDHFDAIAALAKRADGLIHAGDPDPEGQRLVDEVLEVAGLTAKPCKRVLINDNNPGPIRKAFDNLRDNADFQPLSMSALARAVCDQRYGYNLSRACTLAAQEKGVDGVLSVGRVQTPILGLVVARDRLHEGHAKQAFYTVQASVAFDGRAVHATYQPTASDVVDDKGRLTDKAAAMALTQTLHRQQARIIKAETKPQERAAALPYNLLALQADAAALYRLSPKRVMEITQALRDKHRAITYNRSDCRYLNEERHGEAPGLLSALAGAFPDMVAGADSALKSKAFNSGKVGAHHAIIPTEQVPDRSQLSPEEAHVYGLIVRQYVAQFYPPERWRTTTVEMTTDQGQTLRASGRVDGDAGWRTLWPRSEKAKDSENDEPKVNLEGLACGDQGPITACEAKEAFTKAPPLYSMATLLKDLARVAKYVTDPKIRSLLLSKDDDKQDEAGGIGTAATRDSHIETLFKRGFLIEQGKTIAATALGRQFHDALPDFAVKPDLTALWHEQQRRIEAGELPYTALIASVDETIAAEVARIKANGLAVETSAPACPVCGKGHLRKRQGKTKDGKTTVFWGCAAYPECKAAYPDKRGKPDLSPPKPPELSEHKCPDCGKPLIRRPAKKKGVFWWGCSGFPGCSYRAFDNNGKPQAPKSAKAS
jgi:DNA topoisomerase-3